MNLVELVRNAGVVGAGGAGFPTYKKIDTQVETVIANGAECEPLLFKDELLMINYPQEIIAGLEKVMQHVGAKQGIIALKAKKKNAIQALTLYLPSNIKIYEMGNFYPVGDEYEVVYHSTGKRIPAGGIPLDIGIVVQNVETLYNINRAVDNKPVTHSLMTIHGHVKNPLTAWFPLGMPYRSVLAFAGGTSIDNFVLVDGGPMMGKVVTDLSKPVIKTSSGILVIDRNSKLAIRKSQPEQAFKRVGKSACDQCSDCTEMCPRYLLGYPIKPHLVMRSLLTTGQMSESLTHWAQACCECNICSLWACPEDLDPRNICVTTKRDLKQNNKWLSPEQLQNLSTDVHPLKEYRGVPTDRLAQRLGLHIFKKNAPLNADKIEAEKVFIPLQQHIGAAPLATVIEGNYVKTGDVLAVPEDGQLSVPVHASIDGKIVSVGEKIIIEKK